MLEMIHSGSQIGGDLYGYKEGYKNTNGRVSNFCIAYFGINVANLAYQEQTL